MTQHQGDLQHVEQHHEHLFGHLVEPAVPAAQQKGESDRPVSFAVLASSSAGNCSVLIHERGGARRATLIDAGLSPRRTRRELADLGVSLEQIDDVVITHLDSDHFHVGWLKALPQRAKIHLHKRHVARARSMGIDRDALTAFEDVFRVARTVVVHPTLLSHDQWGVAVFRFDFGGATLGFATDVGRVTSDLTAHLEGVDVLAIESNYCPVMQVQSGRPEFLKRRIMGGSGHLSNDQCRDAVEAIAPSRHVVLLHLSRQCNTPERAAEQHAGAAYELTVARHDAPTQAIHICGPAVQAKSQSRATVG